MNKNIIISLFVLLLATSCTEKYVLDSVPAYIGFGATTDGHASKALVTSSDALQNDNMLGVYGQLNYDGHAAKVYEGEKLKYEAGLWRAYGSDAFIPKYWTEGCDYNFALISPYTAVGTTASNATIGSGAANFDYTSGSYTINCTSVSKDSPDLLVGTAQRSIPLVGATSSDYAPVDVTLKHAFAAIEFRVKNSSGKTVTDISNIQLTNVKTSGNLSVPTAGAFTWGSLTTPTENENNYKVLSGNILTSGFAYGTDEAVNVYGNAIVMIPQLVEVGNSAPHIFFSFQYKREGDAEYNAVSPYDLSDPSIVEAFGFRSWEAGKKYVYTATITTNTIIFQVDVKDWRDGGTFILE